MNIHPCLTVDMRRIKMKVSNTFTRELNEALTKIRQELLKGNGVSLTRQELHATSEAKKRAENRDSFP